MPVSAIRPTIPGAFYRSAHGASWRLEHICRSTTATICGDRLGHTFNFAVEYIEGKPGQKIKLWLGWCSATARCGTDVLYDGRAIAEAMRFSHARGVILRDVKRQYHVANDGRVVLRDLAGVQVQLGSSGEVFGSAHYIAPEQARRSSEAVPQSDLYSLV